jgi:hypothetical protein
MIRAALHTLAAVVGFVIIGCVVHASIMASGGYGQSASPLMIALGCGLSMGSIAVGMAWGDRRWFVTGRQASSSHLLPARPMLCCSPPNASLPIARRSRRR